MTYNTIEIFGVKIKTEDAEAVNKLESTLNLLLLSIASYGEVEVNRTHSIDEHNSRCTLIARILLDHIPDNVLSETDVALFSESTKIKEYLVQACGLHDVGKCRIPEQILLKPTALNDLEFQIIQEHTSDPNRNLFRYELESNQNIYISILKDCIRSHHENWDGSGYPDGTAGDETPFAGRLMRVVDVLDSLMTKTPYRTPLSFDDAHKEILKLKGVLFDPIIVNALILSKELLRVSLVE